ncbi:ABC transporter permease [Paenibacillus thermotolerans]|uniref:ABC transporter permease n=1 Tax=Paenibacillus thermotolerans TaxID=3027807 RepID=UPI002368DBE6|nr:MULTISPECIES: ABC transporter permease subunit [unclassified Paenibacillus]
MSEASLQLPKEKAVKATKRKYPLKTNVALYLLLLPTIGSLFLFNYIPMYGIIIAFEKYSVYKGILHSEWVGFEHFRYFLTDEKFWSVMRNTILINLYDLVFGFTAPIVFALLANELYSKVFKRTVQTISYLPHFLSWVVVAGVVYQFLSPTSGLLNQVLHSWFGIEPIYFMTEKALFKPIVVIVDIWKGVGWSAILYFAVIAGIDKHLYEAAWIDGASRFKQVIYVTLPGMYPMIVLLFLLRLSSMFGIGFERIFVLQNPTLYDVSEVVSTYVYRLGLEKAQFSLTTAIGLTESVLGFLLLLSANKLAKKWVGLGLY